MSGYFKGKKVLVTGGTGLIGIPLVKKLVRKGAQVRVVSLDEGFPFEHDVEFIKGDLRDKDVCADVVRDIQIVFHLAGIKGSIGVAKTKASTFLIGNILIDIQIMEAARKAAVENFLYVSSICVYPPARVFKEKNAWTGLPHPSDRFGGIAKMVGEMQLEAYKLQYGLKNLFVVRPTNTYGPYDNFNPESSLVIPALIYRVLKGENPLKIWGDGSAVRDFLYSEDAADFLILMVEKQVREPLNLGTGEPVSIKKLAETIAGNAHELTGKEVKIKWDTAKPAGEKYRVTSIEKARELLRWSPKTDIEEGIHKTMKWYKENKSRILKRFSILTEE
ncbi:MAG: NAD-dependent epimerase/dehydratase family protein [bacterium]